MNVLKGLILQLLGPNLFLKILYSLFHILNQAYKGIFVQFYQITKLTSPPKKNSIIFCLSLYTNDIHSTDEIISMCPKCYLFRSKVRCTLYINILERCTSLKTSAMKFVWIYFPHRNLSNTFLYCFFRLLNQKIEITLYSPEEAGEKMDEIRKQQENAKGRLRSNRYEYSCRKIIILIFL